MRILIGVTGHRPKKCEPEETVRGLFRDVWLEAKPTGVITGMADGCDLWAADEAQKLGIVVIAAVPFDDHIDIIENKELYEKIMWGCLYHEVVSPKFEGKETYFKRNRYIVDESDRLLAYMKDSRSGTGHCVRYAEKVGVPIRNIYGRTVGKASSEETLSE